MKYRHVFFLILISLLVIPGNLPADTIFFQDGTSINCIVHEEKEIWKEIDDPNFLEIEAIGGAIGFWNRGQIDRIEKNDLYVPPDDDTLDYIRKLIEERRLILPSGISEIGGAIFEGASVEKPVAGKIIQTINWVTVGKDTASRADDQQAQNGTEFQSGQVISTERNARTKFSVEPSLIGGLSSNSTLRIQRLNHAEHLMMYELQFELERGQFWCEIKRSIVEGGSEERVKLAINGRSIVTTKATVHCQVIPGEQFRMTLVEGTVEDVPTGTSLLEGQTLVVYLSGEEKTEMQESTVSLLDWRKWEQWKPEDVKVSINLMPVEPESAPILAEMSVFRQNDVRRQSFAAAEPLTDSLPEILNKYRKALELYKEENGQYPEEETGLAALHTNSKSDPYGTKNLPLHDIWSNQLIYEIKEWPAEDGSTVVRAILRSIGPNGIDERGLGDDIQ